MVGFLKRESGLPSAEHLLTGSEELVIELNNRIPIGPDLYLELNFSSAWINLESSSFKP